MAAEQTTDVHSLNGTARAADPAGSRRLGLALVVISMAQLMLVLDELIVNTALPHIQGALHFSGTGLEWVVTGYAVTFGGLLMLGGRAGDILGRRRMFSAGILAFSLASLLGGRYVIPESQRHPRRWDLPGAVTGTAGFALLIYGLTRGATGPDGISHWGDTATVAALAGAAVALTAFGLIEARTAQPLLPLWIFADRNRAGVYLILLCLAATFFGMFFFLTLFTQVVWGYSALRGGLAYLPFIGGFIVVAGICTRLVSRLGARVPMTIGAVLAPVGMFWLSRVHEHSSYLTGVCLPLLVFAGTAGLIFVPLTMALVAGISDQHAGIASSMFNAGQQVGGAVGLAVVGSVAWTIVNNHVRRSLAGAPAGHAALPGSARFRPVYDHALTAGVTSALTIGAAATVLALVVTLVAIRVRREDLPDSPLPA